MSGRLGSQTRGTRKTGRQGAALLSLLFGMIPGAQAVAWAPPAAAATAPSGLAPVDLDIPKAPAISAKAAILIAPESERILFSRKANDRLPMASTTKIMTALVVLERLPLDARVTASLKASETIGSGMELKEGETFTVEELLNALLVLSANDAAVALAEATAGSVGAFAELMNAKAKELGLKNSHFVNPHGMTAKGHYSSAFDLAHIAAAALADHTFRTIVDTRSYTLNRPDGTTTTFTNSNKLLEQVGWVTGVKTGSTPRAGRCLVASGTRDGRTLISVVLGTEHSTIASKECLELLEYGFAHYRRAVVAVRGEPVTDVPIPSALGSRLDLVAGRTLAVSVYADDEVTSTIRVRSDMGLPISKGEVLGTLTAKVNGGEIATIDLLAADTVEQPSFTNVRERLRGSWPPGLLLAEVTLAQR